MQFYLVQWFGRGLNCKKFPNRSWATADEKMISYDKNCADKYQTHSRNLLIYIPHVVKHQTCPEKPDC